MRFSIIATILTCALAGLVFLVSATPVIVTTDMMIKRDNSDIIGIFTKLKASLVTPPGEIDKLVETNAANQESVEPLIREITAALDASSSELAALSTSSRSKRQSDDEVAQLVAEIVSSIVTTLGGLVGSAATIPGLGGLLIGVDTSLNQVLLGLSILLQGVLRLVAHCRKS